MHTHSETHIDTLKLILKAVKRLVFTIHTEYFRIELECIARICLYKCMKERDWIVLTEFNEIMHLHHWFWMVYSVQSNLLYMVLVSSQYAEPKKRKNETNIPFALHYTEIRHLSLEWIPFILRAHVYGSSFLYLLYVYV